MPEEIWSLKARVERRDLTIVKLRKQIADLEREASSRKAVVQATVEGSDKDGDGDTEEGEEEGVGLPEPIYDDDDDTYRCTECAWEVVEGLCQGCKTEFNWTEDNEETSLPSDSLSTETANDTDRNQTPRGTTPLRSIGPFRPLPGYTHKAYAALLQRGATRLMIETFHLEYTPARGIFAWADGTLFSEFGGPKMQKGDFWKIQLGRRFDLDEDDLDGAGFVEGVLEEAVLFPAVVVGGGRKAGGGGWETVEESPGVWVTRKVKCQNKRVGDGEGGGGVGGGGGEGGGDGDDENEGGAKKEDDDDDDDEDEDDDENGPSVEELYDSRLEVPFVDDGPVLLYPGYETTDESDSDNEMIVVGEGVAETDGDVDMDEDPGAEIQASVPDGVYRGWGSRETTPEGSAVIDGAPRAAIVTSPGLELGAEGQGTNAGEHEETSTLDSDLDSVDSDFDADEELSGDEGLREHAAVLKQFKYTY